MQSLYFTPGPSQLYPTVKKHIEAALKNDICSISHRGTQFMHIVQSVKNNVRVMMKIPNSHHLFFLGSSLESMERTIQNTVQKNSFHIIGGAFGQTFANASLAQGNRVTTHILPPGELLNPKKLQIPRGIELICITQNETSNGSTIPTSAIYSLKKKYPAIPIAVDIVSAAPYPLLDFSLLDCAFFSVQKGFGLPSGLSVLVVNDVLVKKSKVKGFHSFAELERKEEINQTPETPNVLNLYLLSCVTSDMIKKGLPLIRKEIREKADIIETLVSRHKNFLTYFISEKSLRSKTVIALAIKGGNEPLVTYLGQKGLIVGRGYKEYKKTHIRIANFPQHSIADFQRLGKEIDLFLAKNPRKHLMISDVQRK